MFGLYEAILIEMYGEWYEFTDEEFDKIYTVYNRFSDNDGCTKLEMRKVAPCLNQAI